MDSIKISQQAKSAGYIIILLALSFSFLINTISITNKNTRRTAEELVIINEIKLQEEESKHDRLLSEAEMCVKGGGRPEFGDNGDWTDCKKN